MSETPTTVPAGTVSSKYVLAGGKRDDRGKKSQSQGLIDKQGLRWVNGKQGKVFQAKRTKWARM